MTDRVHKQRRMGTVSQTVELPAKRQNRRHPLEWKRSVLEQTVEPGAAVARITRENNINANQVRAWRKLYAQGLLFEDAQTQAMLPVVVDAQSDRLTFRCRMHTTRLHRPSLQTDAFSFNIVIRPFG